MPEPPETADAQAIVAGTLCLMSCPAAATAAVFVRRIVANLERLADHPACAIEMRVVCRRLAAQWEQRLADGDRDRGTTPYH